MFCSFYISSAKSILIAWPWNKSVFFTFYHFWNQYATTQLSYLSTHAPLPLKAKIKHTAPLVKAGRQARVEISIQRGKVLHLQRKTKTKVEDCG